MSAQSQKFSLQHHWYRTTQPHSLSHSLLHWILLPVSLIFRALVALRRMLYRDRILYSEHLLLPVIVVGNITVGGTGKTPLTLALAQQLSERGWHPLIISRGYKGTARKPMHVKVADNAQQVGDEPLLMALRNICPVWVGKNRGGTAHAALKAHPECDVVLCDDGLQHYRLQRDVEIAVVDAERGFGNGHMLPAGPLREPVSRLKTVDAVVMNGGSFDTNLGANLPGLYEMHLSGDVFYNLLDPTRKATAADFHQLKNHAVAGIGNPQRYFQHLETLGIAFIPHVFPDHYPYSADELAFADCEALLLTEKDAVKCSSFADARFWVLPVHAQIDPALLDHILRKVAPHGLQTA